MANVPFQGIPRRVSHTTLQLHVTRARCAPADAAILVYDVTSAASFERVRSWIKELKQMVSPILRPLAPRLSMGGCTSLLVGVAHGSAQCFAK